MNFFKKKSPTSPDEILDGDLAASIDDRIRLNESEVQLSFAKWILVGTLLTFLVLTGFAVFFISTDQNPKLDTLMDFTGKWFSPVWAIVGGLITYFFPNKKK